MKGTAGVRSEIGKLRNRGVVVTYGDPCGVGPELLVRTLGRPRPPTLPIRLVGDRKLLEKAAREAVGPGDASTAERFLSRLDDRFPLIATASPAILTPGAWQGANVSSSLEALETAADIALKEKAVLVTGPMDKRFFAAVGLAHGGHTEFLARFCGSADEPLMWFDSPRLRVGLLTRHLPLADVPAFVHPDRLARGVDLALGFLARTRPELASPLAVAALDPHCGEWGTIARNDLQVRDWIGRLRSRGVPVEGPFSADTLFTSGSLERFSGILCWYHDQGMIPVKLLAFTEAVNVTLGLPLLRTSPAHGVAYDIAWRGIASPTSTLKALSLALTLAPDLPAPEKPGQCQLPATRR